MKSLRRRKSRLCFVGKAFPCRLSINPNQVTNSDYNTVKSDAINFEDTPCFSNHYLYFTNHALLILILSNPRQKLTTLPLNAFPSTAHSWNLACV